MFSVWLNKEGSKALMKDYQKATLQILMKQTEPIGSGNMWAKVNDKISPSTVSRASVIFFLQDLVKYDYAQLTKTTGKGGYRDLYKIHLTKEELITKITTDINTKLIEAYEDIFPEQELSFLSFS